MDASKAREITFHSGGNSELKNCLLIIEKMANMGRDNCYLYSISNSTIKDLKKLGYMIEPGADYGETNCHVVKW